MMKKFFIRRFTCLAIAILVLPLMLAASLGNFTRFHADDFCAVGQMNQSGFWRAVDFWYQSWNGRFAFTFFSQLFGMGGTNLARLLPIIILLLWLVGLAWFFSAFLKRLYRLLVTNKEIHLHQNFRSEGFLLAALNLYLVFYTIPNLFQSFLWESGMVNYTMPILIWTYIAAFLLSFDPNRAPHKNGNVRFISLVFLLSAISILSSGFSETHSMVQITLLIFWVCMSLISIKSKGMTQEFILLMFALIGTIAGFIITAAAPGNTNRMLTINPEGIYPKPLDLLITAAQHAYITLHAIIKHHWAQLTMGFGVAACTGWLLAKKLPPSSEKSSLRTWLRKDWFYLYVSIPVFGFGFLILAMLPAAYVLQSYPDSRALMLHHSMIIFSGIVFSVCSGLILGRFIKFSNPSMEALVCILLLTGLFIVSYRSTQQTIQTIPERRDFAVRWDTRDAKLKLAKRQGKSDVAAAGLEQYFGLHDLAFDPDNWINACMAMYYGVSSISGR